MFVFHFSGIEQTTKPLHSSMFQFPVAHPFVLSANTFFKPSHIGVFLKYFRRTTNMEKVVVAMLANMVIIHHTVWLYGSMKKGITRKTVTIDTMNTREICHLSIQNFMFLSCHSSMFVKVSL